MQIWAGLISHSRQAASRVAPCHIPTFPHCSSKAPVHLLSSPLPLLCSVNRPTGRQKLQNQMQQQLRLRLSLATPTLTPSALCASLLPATMCNWVVYVFCRSFLFSSCCCCRSRLSVLSAARNNKAAAIRLCPIPCPCPCLCPLETSCLKVLLLSCVC